MDLNVLLKDMEIRLIEERWLPVIKRDWPVIKKTKYNRSVIIKFDDSEKEEIMKELSKLHPSAVTEFLKLFGSFKEFSGNLKNIDKGKLILYQLLSGCTSRDIPVASYSTFRRIYQKFWVKNADGVHKWCTDWMGMLSTPDIRVLHSHIHNPQLFKPITMFIDGKDFISHLTSIQNEMRLTKKQKSNLKSRKLNWKNAGKVVILDDIKLNPLNVSRMCGANEKYDGHLMKEMGVYDIMDPLRDCLIFDHHFDSDAQKMINLEECKKRGFSQLNLCPNIRKLKDIPLTPDELNFQTQHSAFRSKQETESILMSFIYR